MTLSKLAKLANVSVSTASKAFAGSREVNEDTRDMIFAVAKQHGCFKKFYNAKYPKLVIAIIAPEFTSTYYAQFLSFMQQYLDPRCELCVSATEFSSEREAALIEYYTKHSSTDGILLVQSLVDAPDTCETPVVFINPKHEQPHGATVWGTIKPALNESIEYLIKRGVTSCGFIGEPLTTSKHEWVRQSLEEHGLTLDESYVSISSERFEEGGYRAMQALFDNGRVPRAVICSYDNMAIGAIRCICDRGLSVPDDVAVLGMDDIPQAAYLDPPLASISSNTEEMCRLASQAMLSQIYGESVSTQQTVTAQLRLRKSFQIGENIT